MEKNNKALYIIIGALSAIIVVLAIVVGLLVVKKPATNNAPNATVVLENPATGVTNTLAGDNNVATDNTEATGDTSTGKNLFANEVEQDDYKNAKADAAKGFVRDGYEFTVPSDYTLGYTDEVGAYVYVADVFQMKVGVRDRSYEEYVKMGDEVTQPTIDNGGTITQAPAETTVNGNKYFYFVNYLMGGPGIVAYTKLPDGKKTLGCHIVMENDNLSYEEYLAVFDSIATTGVATDKADSTKDDIIQRNAFSAHKGETKGETVLSHNGSTLTAKVADGFYSDFTNETDTYASDHFTSDGTRMMVDVYYYPEDPYFDGAKNYVDEEIDSYASFADSYETEGTQKYKVGHNEVYLGIIKYTSEDKTSYRAYGAIDINGKGIYTVEAVTFDLEDPITFEKLEKFFEIELK